jgi:hypothetical protein
VHRPARGGTVVSGSSGTVSARFVRRGSADVWWLALTAAGFVVSTALVVALAMPATARWEAEVRSGNGPRVVVPHTSRGRTNRR